MLRILVLPIVVFVVAVSSSAQTRGGSNRNPPSTPSGSAAPPSVPVTGSGSLFISGKVIVDDGTLLTDRAAIQSLCNGRTHVETYTDSKGYFSFEIKSQNQNQNSVTGDDASDSSQSVFAQAASQGAKANPDPVGNYLRNCQLQAALPGFTSGAVELAAKLSDIGSTDVGTVVLHRMAQVEGFTLSVTTAQAPAKAKKEYDKGRDSQKKKKWDAAQESFQKAVEEYPKYAIAWYELGRVQTQKDDSAAARQSFHQAISADSTFVSPYHELTSLAAREQKWQEVVDTSAQLLKLNAFSFPEDWLLNAAGNYNLRNFDAVEKSALRGLEFDKQHQLPKLEYLLGLTLAQKHDYSGGLEHLRNYLRLARMRQMRRGFKDKLTTSSDFPKKTTADR
jgi:tetratricopeptide (TPR) repeat protein